MREQSNFLYNKKYTWIAALIITCITFTVYLPALQNGFVDWDDNVYVFENQNIKSLNSSFLSWSITATVGSLWHPLTLFSLAFDYSIWGMNPKGYHLTNILLHAFNTFIVFVLSCLLIESDHFKKEKPDKKVIVAGLITALLFGIHPMHVESVAWVSERKDVLCAFFFLLSLLSYLKYTITDSKKWSYYFTSCLFFLLALMSKPMAVSLPIVLLILDYCPLKRLDFNGGFRKLKWVLLDKLPFLMLSLVFSLITILAHGSKGFLNPLELYPLQERIIVAVRATMFYLFKMLLPFNLTPLYPYPSKINYFSFEYMGAFITLVAITLFSIFLLKKSRIFFAIWCYYIVTLLPVIGVVHVGAQAMADRYTYLPSLGPFLLAGLASITVFKKCSKKEYKVIIMAALILLSGMLMNKTIGQLAIWHDSLTLWSHVIRQFPDTAFIGYRGRGRYYYDSGKYQEAIKDFDMAVKLNPQFVEAYDSLGNAYFKLGNYQEAIKNFSMAIELAPQDADFYYNRGIAYRKTGNYQQAAHDLNTAINLNPQYAEAYFGIGNIYFTLGDYHHAKDSFIKAVMSRPRYAEAYHNLGNAYSQLGYNEEAKRSYEKAASLGLK